MNVLILGGNSFFGKKLAKKLIEENHQVTLLNRGSKDDGLGAVVQRIVCDRSDKELMLEKLKGKKFDLVYDQICFDYKTAKETCEIFEEITSRYIFTSSQSVYDYGDALNEEDFIAKDHQVEDFETADSNYAEAKRQAELAFTKYAKFNYVFVRFPIVIGNDDSTKRINFHIERISNEKEIYFPNPEAKISFIHSDFAASALYQLGVSDFNGAINVASSKEVKLKDFMNNLGELLGKKVHFANESSEDSHSPYGIQENWYMDMSKLTDLGIKGEEIIDWLPKVID